MLEKNVVGPFRYMASEATRVVPKAKAPPHPAYCFVRLEWLRFTNRFQAVNLMQDNHYVWHGPDGRPLRRLASDLAHLRVDSDEWSELSGAARTISSGECSTAASSGPPSSRSNDS